jgi:hypothetical protein
MLNDEQYDELARLLLADIRALVPLVFPYNTPVSEANIRLMAVLMRRWLVDGDLKKLLAPLKLPALFDVQANGDAKAYAARTGVFRYFLTAGVMMDGRPVAYIYDSPKRPDEIDLGFLREGRTSLTLKKFLAQPRLFFEDQWFTTEEILRFVANKLGGNHVDFDRSGQWQKLDAANRYMAYGGPVLPAPPSGTEVYLTLEPTSHEIIGGVHLEVVSAAASFVQVTIGGEQLCNLKTDSSLIGRLRKYLRRRPGVTMIERSSSECQYYGDSLPVLR